MKKALLIGFIVISGSVSLAECMLTGPGGEQKRCGEEATKQRRRILRKKRKQKACVARQMRKLRSNEYASNAIAEDAPPRPSNYKLINLLEEAEDEGYHGVFEAYAYFIKNIQDDDVDDLIESMEGNPFAEKIAKKLMEIRFYHTKFKVERSLRKDRIREISNLRSEYLEEQS